MAKCTLCNKCMIRSKGCGVPIFIINGKRYTRIRVGSDRDFFPDMDDGERCSECGARKGYFHHWGCDIERCPVCGGQLISCGCNIAKEVIKRSY